ncbi:MAG: beta-galactosidase domain 4-containing protein, partial [Maribacter sp.]|uniref:beta-galactosidase domain 4-containing protein n=1 Tax=Maribacter sp. TaxID=1897614 RepID=UPI003C79517C
YGIQMQDPDTLEFYVNAKADHKRFSAKTKVGVDFYDTWHHVAGVYNGQKLTLYVDDKVVGETEFTGNMKIIPFPLCLGREAENQDQGEHSGRMSSMVLDDVRIFDHAVSISELKTQVNDAVLALDFENDSLGEDFYAIGLGGRTYGVIWPDRTIQPEIHQIKKSGQPIGFELIDAEKGLIKISNYHHFKDLNLLNGHWSLMEDGKELEKGTLSMDLPAQKSKEATIPFKTKSTTGELILTIGFSLKEKERWATEGHEVAWEQFILEKGTVPQTIALEKKALNVEERPAELEISGDGFTYVFNKNDGKWTSLRYKGTEYLEGGPDFMVWRAPLANDVDPWGSYKFYSNKITPGYGRSIDNELRTLGLRDLKTSVDEVNFTNSTKGVKVNVKVWSTSSLDPKLIMYPEADYSAFERDEIWTIHPDGTLELDQEVTPHGAMPEMLPKEGLQFQLPKAFNQVTWYGRGPFETYPDRKTAAKFGVYNSDADAMYEPYILPQDYGNRTDVRWVRIMNAQGKGLLISGDQAVNFSLHKYDTDNLSRAVYTYQLKEVPFTVLNIDHKVSGVGGTALRQLETYREKATSGRYRLTVKPF